MARSFNRFVVRCDPTKGDHMRLNDIHTHHVEHPGDSTREAAQTTAGPTRSGRLDCLSARDFLSCTNPPTGG